MNSGKVLPDGPHLCLVTDPTLLDIVERVEIALAAGITMLQIRAHQYSTRQFYQLAQVLVERCRYYGVTCIMNDRIDIGMALGVDGFQLGHNSLPLSIARDVAGVHYLWGVSVHSLEEAQTALQCNASFLVAGTMFPSRSHPGEAVTGPALIHTLKTVDPTIPVLGIGGITSEHVPAMIKAGANGVAVISAILMANNIAEAVKAFRQALGK